MKKFNVSFDDETFERVEKFIQKNKINRSALLRTSALLYIDAQERMPDLLSEIDKLKDAVKELQVNNK